MPLKEEAYTWKLNRVREQTGPEGKFLLPFEYSLRSTQHVPTGTPVAAIPKEPVVSLHTGGWKSLKAGMQIKFARRYTLTVFSLHIQIHP